MEENTSLKTYNKTSKFLRLVLIMILKNQGKQRVALRDEEHFENLSHEMHLFKQISQIISESSKSLPFDLISLALDVFNKVQLPLNP